MARDDDMVKCARHALCMCSQRSLGLAVAVALGHGVGGEGEQRRHAVAPQREERLQIDSFSLFLVFIIEISLVDLCSSDSLSLIKII